MARAALAREPAPAPGCEDEFRAMVGRCGEAIAAGLDMFMTGDDANGPHKARVGLRRLTTCLDAFAPILRRRRMAALRQRAKRMFRNLGRVRDSDIHLDARASLPGHETRATANRRLRETVRLMLKRRKAQGFAATLAAAVAPGGVLFRRSAGAKAARCGPVAPIAAAALEAAWTRAVGYGRKVSRIPEADRHDFRKDLKTLRYLAEFFAPAFPALVEPPFASDLPPLQDALGVLNDYHVALTLDRRKPGRAALPPREAAALQAADAAWMQLCAAPLPWRA